MPIELEVEHPRLPPSPAAVVSRYAVKAVVVRGGRLLMMRSKHEDFEFPGGGVEAGEAPHEALTRELAEECGIASVRIGELLVRTVERRPGLEPNSVFVMTSDYFRAFADDAPLSVETKLDAYELDLALTPT